MAVITLRGFRVSALRDSAMIRVELGSGAFLVGPAALCHDVELKALGVGALYRMGTVAIAAHGQGLVGFPYKLGMDAFRKCFLNPMVAVAACRGDVFRVDARFDIC